MKNAFRLAAAFGLATLVGCSGSGTQSPGDGGAGGGSAAGSSGLAGSGARGGTGGGTVIKKYIGNISIKNQDIPANFANLWQQVTMEANSKWGFVQPDSPDKWVWEPVDQVYQYALDHNMVFKEHTFFWNYEQPAWVNDGNVATVAPLWIKAFCERYPKTAMIDVANEPQHHPAPYKNGMGGEGTSGYDWVVQAHKWARQYCPNAILIVNEYNNIEYDGDFNPFILMMQKLLAAGAPIDAIGVQGHEVANVGVTKAKSYIDKLWNMFHLPIYVTEFDIDRADDTQQKTIMQDTITMFWNHPAVQGITYWGYAQGLTWRPNGWLIATDGTFRPAMTWLQEFIHSH